MAQTDITMGMALVVLITMWAAGAMGQSTDCTNELISMSSCLNYIAGNSSTPSSGCCTQLGSVVQSSPQCLCQVLNGGGSSLGIDINQTRALALPGQCNVQTPPVSRCNGNASSPTASPSGTSGSSSTNSGSGSKTVPSTDSNNTSNGSSIKFSISLLLLLIAVSYGSTFMES